jgi:hypothetical protein
MIIIITFLLAYFFPRFRSFLLDSNDPMVSLSGAAARDHVQAALQLQLELRKPKPRQEYLAPNYLILQLHTTELSTPLLFLRLTSAKMDLNSLKDQVSNLTLYDIKAGVRKVQNGMRGPRSMIPVA